MLIYYDMVDVFIFYENITCNLVFQFYKMDNLQDP